MIRLIASDEEDVDYMLRKLREGYEKWGRTMNGYKTEYLRIGEEKEDPQLQVREIKRCNKYKYLGSIISAEGTSKRDVHNRVQQGRISIRILICCCGQTE